MTDNAVIHQTDNDASHEAVVASAIASALPDLRLHFIPTPKFYPFDFHVMRQYDRGSADYWGGLEVKWFTHSSDRPGVFNYNKALHLLSMTVHRDDPNCYHRVAFRFTDGILVAKARSVANLEPRIFTRKDTDETDLVVAIDRRNLQGKWLEVAT